MKHRKFGREKSVRQALLKSLAVALIERDKIQTTEARAKAVRPLVEKMVSTARKQDLAARRLLFRRLNSRTAQKLVTTLGPRFHKRLGGYTRITRLPSRNRDGAPMAIIEFV